MTPTRHPKSLQLVRAEDQKRMAWRNGGGVTTEIAVHPPRASLDDFDWRVSTAHVGADGPFSSFPHVDRTIAILEGTGLVLSIDRDEPIRLSQGTAPLTFAADRPTVAHLIDGPIVDLNVMSRRSVWRHTVDRVVVDGRVALTSDATPWIVYCESGRVTVSDAAEALDISRGDVVIGYTDRAELSCNGTNAVYVVSFHHAGAV